MKVVYLPDKNRAEFGTSTLCREFRTIILRSRLGNSGNLGNLGHRQEAILVILPRLLVD